MDLPISRLCSIASPPPPKPATAKPSPPASRRTRSITTGIYGDHVGRPEIACMMAHLFHGDAGPDYRWEMFDPVVNGDIAYAWSLSSFTSTRDEFKGRRVVIDGMSRFRLRDGRSATMPNP